MQRRPLQTTQRKAERSKSQAIRQTNSGNKNLKLTNRGQNIKTLPNSKQKKDPLLKVSQSPKTKKPPKRQQISSQNPNKKASRQSSETKQKPCKKIVSYKSQQSDHQSQKELKMSVVQIQFPPLDDAIDDDINMLSISNYPIKNNMDFLRETHLISGQSKNQYLKADARKHEDLKKSTGKIRKTNSKKPKDQQSKSSRSKTASQKKFLLGSNRKQTLSKSHKKLQKYSTGLKVSVRPIQKSTKGALSKTKKGKKEKSSSTETNKANSPKKVQKIEIDAKSAKSPTPKDLPKSIPKPSKSKKKKIPLRKNLQGFNPGKLQQQSSSDTTKTPTLQQLQHLRDQNEKYKIFLATSAFKVDDLRKQIQQHKQIRQNERGIYNFQLNNLKKQLDANKKYLGHLYSYDEPSNKPGFIPEQIIVETDNESSSVLDSMNAISKMSKQLAPDEIHQEGSSNKIRKSNESMINITKSNASSLNENEEDERLGKTNLTALMREMKEDLLREEAQLKFLSEIHKIPSLQVRLSLEDSDNSKTDKHNQENWLNGTNKLSSFKQKKEASNLSNDEGQNALLLLNSIEK